MSDQRVAGASHLLVAANGKSAVCAMPLAEAKSAVAAWKVEIGDDPEKFAEKAKEVSDCPTADNGGDLGFVVRSSCSDEINEILFEQPEGKVYGPIVTPAGIHLIFLHRSVDCRTNPRDLATRGSPALDLPALRQGRGCFAALPSDARSCREPKPNDNHMSGKMPWQKDE